MKYPAIGISPLFRRGGGYNATTTAWIARVVAEGGSVTTAEAIAVNTLTNSIPIEEFDRLWVHGLQNQIAARTSIANAATADLITNVNSTTFTAGQGFTGNGTTMYLNTNYNPAVDGVKYTQNSASFGVYSRTNNSSLAESIGVYSLALGSISSIYPNDTGKAYCYVQNFPASDNIIVSDSLGLYSAVRTSALSNSLYKNGVLAGGTTQASLGIPSFDFYICARNNNGAASGFDTRQIAISFAGSGSINQATFYTAVQNLATTLGFNV
jgi:hypothetical protein